MTLYKTSFSLQSFVLMLFFFFNMIKVPLVPPRTLLDLSVCACTVALSLETPPSASSTSASVCCGGDDQPRHEKWLRQLLLFFFNEEVVLLACDALFYRGRGHYWRKSSFDLWTAVYEKYGMELCFYSWMFFVFFNFHRSETRLALEV